MGKKKTKKRYKRCFCGKPSTHMVDVPNFKIKYCHYPRCDDCTERAVRSYPDVKATPLDT